MEGKEEEVEGEEEEVEGKEEEVEGEEEQSASLERRRYPALGSAPGGVSGVREAGARSCVQSRHKS